VHLRGLHPLGERDEEQSAHEVAGNGETEVFRTAGCDQRRRRSASRRRARSSTRSRDVEAADERGRC